MAIMSHNYVCKKKPTQQKSEICLIIHVLRVTAYDAQK